ncbi:TPA: UDP-N-acetylglucosamine--undecaprenyl-phosphate N-acetylglucosaminephosphotransferase [Vibrio parahaemolyticus]|uniref:UDP-N-acetylglucosamine--undecaprenyl-phosphate N-acetylglucosaminephosphotransferase n=1 Tax=Vibrio parahaemolyticus TaxID=670 RepID=UPI001A26B071|nr:UDP-N-acetylglucosamine--undecaprenyl-phosphate N-acetylglucosaminephosphotransferase [Vibrio parahaemolyticus]EGQ8807485.1 UDP-N-acetylglucosamine--undecaprenyl-phosphate N-acetylglucosaminephosphotransferase [Vibrio parahaemolyticus]EGQ8890582.1 UDP-N-acetylglucosamine--undecaprenyl-phosphate N-acetylglucosaminephosphotransferase [Vibrio parahaemolyticus]EGQ8964824.1 UDP-N-acetylglucosamine--undecaprenyl-phosphate N-acetylglucosaminephosphotransferase [Vibrio parahaemolyticus]EGR3169544.1 
MNNAYLFVFILSFVLLFVMRKVAKRVGLVDKPNARKLHQGVVPLVGGISIFSTILVGFLLFLPMNDNLSLYLSCSAVLIVLGALDDYYDVSFKIRLIIQAGISLAMIYIGGHSLHDLGYLMGSETIALNEVTGAVITVIAVIGAINAFNMVDGIDGLLGGLASVTFTALGIVFAYNGNEYLATICLLIVTAMLPYIFLNLGFPLGRRFKIFMGDAGSMFIGFTVVWMLIRGTQEPGAVAFKPVTALWLIALPLMDMATIMIRRIRKGQSPFQPDREHLHHICQRIGLSPGATLIFICSMASICAAVGLWADFNNISESIMFITFLVLFCIYFLIINHIWKLTSWLKKSKSKDELMHQNFKL